MKKALMMLPLACAIAAGNGYADQMGFEVSAGVNATNWDKNRDLEDSTGLMGALGYRINDRWGIEAMYVQNDTETDPGNFDVDAQKLHIDALYHFRTDERVQPYFLMGMGKNRYKYSGGSDSESTFNAGAGIKAYLTDNFLLRGDMRAIRGSEDGHIDLGTNIALTYFFGVRDKAPAPVVKAAPASDADNDGVVDTRDACPQTPANVAVDSRGCPQDSDNDGVADYLDQCPNTESGLKVDDQGCAISLTEAVEIKLGVNFDNNAAVVKPAYFAEIGEVAEFMKSYKDSAVELQGYTDSRGSEAYNKALSQRRADAVRQVLIEQFGIDAARVTAVGYGEANPIASNETAAGREENRRVVASVQSKKTTQLRK
ncbi:OmpA family protein [Simiduia sp. 21SJ11W-1]|uniref:OmpA family protein n=1 Tax=Simiduia sp. 21SJ11W-1 TaxID=2909669 RepID=UPI0020A1C97E|nr:OmpA family protein [Simiduia sp. 21SJ11W-1]UTA48021.1 OmpA family protein [Simiduia sp. 21SJ11W-1]